MNMEEMVQKMVWLEEGVESLLKAATCPVCNHRLSPAVVSCVEGHVICKKCKQGHNVCPSCQNSFSNEKNATLKRILEAYPNVCRHSACQLMRWGSIEDHEKLCESRVTICRVCNWKGMVKDLDLHVKLSLEHLQNKEDIMWDDFKSTVSKPFVKSYAFKINNEIFWKIMRNNPEEKAFSLKFICVPTKEVEANYRIEIKMVNENLEHTTKTKLTFNAIEENSKENLIILGHGLMRQFVKGNKLQYKITVIKCN